MGKFIIGFRQVKKALKNGLLERVLVAGNAPSFIKNEFKDAEKFKGDSIKLGTYVGKPFPVAVVGVTKKVVK